VEEQSREPGLLANDRTLLTVTVRLPAFLRESPGRLMDHALIDRNSHTGYVDRLERLAGD
jgi:hypothetical protein